jgi:hypothetical protein
MTGEVSVVVTSLAEQQQLLRGGKLRALGMLIPDSFDVEGLGTIPLLSMPIPGLVRNTCRFPRPSVLPFPPTPRPTPNAVLVDAFNKAMATDKVKTWAKENYYLLSGKTGSRVQGRVRCPGIQFCLDPVGTGRRHGDPCHLGIPKPIDEYNRSRAVATTRTNWMADRVVGA